MTILNKITLVLASTISMGSMAADFSFDRPGTGFSTGIAPVGHLAWEQSLPDATYTQTKNGDAQAKTVTLSSDLLLRTGLTPSMELQLGVQGSGWTQTKYQGEKSHDSGFGDVTIGHLHVPCPRPTAQVGVTAFLHRHFVQIQTCAHVPHAFTLFQSTPAITGGRCGNKQYEPIRI